jgi:hypothetical protein
MCAGDSLEYIGGIDGAFDVWKLFMLFILLDIDFGVWFTF